MEEMVGRLIGRYRIIRHLGSGGMGAVYLAERADEQFRKQVAIKLVQPGKADSTMLERFRLERQTLATLDHPNIVKLLDAGTTEDGIPYVIMDYVDGVPISEYCEAHGLTTAERLKLFQEVCAAVHCAHQHLLIHRDIKPSNILVTEECTPKLLDFGIAKLLSTDLHPELRDITGIGPPPMTLKYASPEQLRGEPITIASDIYSLGVLLYELLTGRYPYSQDEASWALVHAICEAEPEKPSASLMPVEKPKLLDTLDAPTLVDAALPHRERPQTLKRRLEGDLDAIVLKAMHKDARQRYASVDHLSEDIKRHFKYLPVHARQASVLYTSGRFLLRHKLVVAVSALLVLSLAGGMAATAWQAHIAERERAKAERRFNDVRQLANSILFDFHEAIRDLPGSTQAQKMLVSKASDYLDKLAREAGSDPALELELAEAYVKLGDVQGNPYSQNLGDTRGAVASYQNALQNARAALSAQPSSREARHALANAYQQLSDVLPIVGNISDAATDLRKALEIFESLSAEKPADSQARADLARCYESLGDLLGGRSQSSLGDSAGALESYQKSLAHLETVLASDTANRRARRGVAVLSMKIANNLSDRGDRAAAHEKYLKAVEILQDLSKSDPTNVSTRRILATVYRRMAASQAEGGNLPGALKACRAALAIYEDLLAADPSNAQARYDRAVALKSLGEMQQEGGDIAGALASYSGVLETVEALSEADPDNLLRRAQLSEMLLTIASLRTQSGESAEAHRLAAKGLAIARSLAERRDATPKELRQFASTLTTCKPADLRDPATALRLARRAVELTKGADAGALDTLAEVYFAMGDRPRAIEAVEKALSLLPVVSQGDSESEMRKVIEGHLARFKGRER